MQKPPRIIRRQEPSQPPSGNCGATSVFFGFFFSSIILCLSMPKIIHPSALPMTRTLVRPIKSRRVTESGNPGVDTVFSVFFVFFCFCFVLKHYLNPVANRMATRQLHVDFNVLNYGSDVIRTKDTHIYVPEIRFNVALKLITVLRHTAHKSRAPRGLVARLFE